MKADLIHTFSELRSAFKECGVEIKEIILDEKSYNALIEYLKNIKQERFFAKTNRCPHCKGVLESFVEFQDMKIIQRAG